MCGANEEANRVINNWKRFTFTSTTGKTRDHGDERHGDPNNGDGGIPISPSTKVRQTLALAAPTKTPEVPAGVETKCSMIVLAAKAKPYKELDLGT